MGRTYLCTAPLFSNFVIADVQYPSYESLIWLSPKNDGFRPAFRNICFWNCGLRLIESAVSMGGEVSFDNCYFDIEPDWSAMKMNIIVSDCKYNADECPFVDVHAITPGPSTHGFEYGVIADEIRVFNHRQ
jgi:hypothetical protein